MGNIYSLPFPLESDVHERVMASPNRCAELIREIVVQQCKAQKIDTTNGLIELMCQLGYQDTAHIIAQELDGEQMAGLSDKLKADLDLLHPKTIRLIRESDIDLTTEEISLAEEFYRGLDNA